MKLAKKQAAAPQKGTPKSGLRPWHLWIGGATSVGALGGMVKSPELVLPMAVGLATAAGMVVVLKLAMTKKDKG